MSSPTREGDADIYIEGLSDLSEILQATKNEAWSCMAEQLRSLDDRKIDEYAPTEGCTDTSDSAVRSCTDGDELLEDDSAHYITTATEEEEEPSSPSTSALLELMASSIDFPITCDSEDENDYDSFRNNLSTRDRNDSLLSIDK